MEIFTKEQNLVSELAEHFKNGRDDVALRRLFTNKLMFTTELKSLGRLFGDYISKFTDDDVHDFYVSFKAKKKLIEISRGFVSSQGIMSLLLFKRHKAFKQCLKKFMLQLTEAEMRKFAEDVFKHGHGKSLKYFKEWFRALGDPPFDIHEIAKSAKIDVPRQRKLIKFFSCEPIPMKKDPLCISRLIASMEHSSLGKFAVDLQAYKKQWGNETSYKQGKYSSFFDVLHGGCAHDSVLLYFFLQTIRKRSRTHPVMQRIYTQLLNDTKIDPVLKDYMTTPHTKRSEFAEKVDDLDNTILLRIDPYCDPPVTAKEIFRWVCMTKEECKGLEIPPYYNEKRRCLLFAHALKYGNIFALVLLVELCKCSTLNYEALADQMIKNGECNDVVSEGCEDVLLYLETYQNKFTITFGN